MKQCRNTEVVFGWLWNVGMCQIYLTFIEWHKIASALNTTTTLTYAPTRPATTNISVYFK